MTRGCTTSGELLKPQELLHSGQAEDGGPAHHRHCRHLFQLFICSQGLDVLLSLALSKDAQKTLEPVFCPLLVHFQRESCVNEDSKCVPPFHNYRDAAPLLPTQQGPSTFLLLVCPGEGSGPVPEPHDHHSRSLATMSTQQVQQHLWDVSN